MKKIKDFNIGDEIETVLRLSDISIRKTSSNADYASLMGYDGEELIDIKIWSLDETKKNILKNGEIYLVNGKLREYQGKPQLNISDLRMIDESDDIDTSAFYEYARLTKEELMENINQYIDAIENPILNHIVTSLIKKYHHQFFTHPAALTMHHNYHSGLAFHVYTMLVLSDSILDVYSYLNKDLLYAGIILHDLGKVLELSGPKGTEYTLIGNLIGHITLCTNEIYRISYEMGVEETDEVLSLIHLIISHHGQLEYGSPKEPLIAEAVVLNLLDNVDAKLASIEKEVSNTKKGEFTNSLPIFERKSFYVPNLK